MSVPYKRVPLSVPHIVFTVASFQSSLDPHNNEKKSESSCHRILKSYIRSYNEKKTL